MEVCWGPLLFIPYMIEMFELVENRLFAYADDSILFANQQTDLLLLPSFNPLLPIWMNL